METVKKIKGKRIRKQLFYTLIHVIIVAVAIAAVCTVLFALVDLPSELQIFIYGFCGAVCFFSCLALPIEKGVLCILSDDRLYYFGASESLSAVCFSRVSDNKRTSFSQDGWILYSAIQKHEYQTYLSFFDSWLSLYGTDFVLTISGVGKKFISQLEKAKAKSPVTYSEEAYGTITPPALTSREGFWQEIWEYCENNSLAGVLRCDEIHRVYFETDIDSIDIELNNRGRDIFITMDNQSVHMTNDDVEQTIEYKDLAGIEDLFAGICNFIDNNS